MVPVTRVSPSQILTFPIGKVNILKIENRVQKLCYMNTNRLTELLFNEKRCDLYSYSNVFERDFDLQNTKFPNWKSRYFEDRNSRSNELAI